jgi:hypothetical protein
MKVQELGVELSASAAETKICGFLPPLLCTSYTVVFKHRGIVNLNRLTLM